MKTLSRRALLRGAGGALVGLPLLSAMIPTRARAQAASVPRRFVLVFSGTCQTHGGLDRAASGVLPPTLPQGWRALEPVRAHASIISSLTLPVFNNSEPPIPGGARNQQHGGTIAPIVSGNQALEHTTVHAAGHTVDQVAADTIGGGTRIASIQARCQAAGYGFGAAKGILSARKSGAQIRGLDPIFSPQVLYDTLFSGFAPSTGTTPGASTPAPLSLQLRKQKSVLDLILGDANRLTRDLSGEDRVRLDQHFEEIRALERRLIPATMGTTPPPPSGNACVVPTDPGADGPINTPGTFAGWSNETARGDLMADLMAMAFACDITRAASWMLTFDQCGLSAQHISGAAADMHAISHQQGGGRHEIEENANWHVERYARLVERLSGLSEGGGTVLDSTCVVYVAAEGNNAHNKQNLTYSIAGCPDVLRHGVLVNAANQHPAHLMMSALEAIGAPTNTFGEISGGPLAGLMV